MAVVDGQPAVVAAARLVHALRDDDRGGRGRNDHVQLARLVGLRLDRQADAVLDALAVDDDERLGEPLDGLAVVDLEVIVGAVGSRPDAQHRDLQHPADLHPLEDFLERGAAQRRIGVARAAEAELRVGPGVDVAGRDGHPELGEEGVARPLDRGAVEIAVEGLLEDALVDLDGVDAGRLGAAALPFEVVAELGIVGVVPGRSETVAEVAGGPVADAHADVHGLQELEGARAIQVSGSRGRVGKLVTGEAAHASSGHGWGGGIVPRPVPAQTPCVPLM